jgi:dTDP-4-amino-4,6-dideoxygalactose transaminase
VTSRAFRVVEMFEEAMAEYAGARYGVAMDSCSSAIALCCQYVGVDEVTIPARTYISVPAAIIRAGGTVKFVDVEWTGAYRLEPTPIVDSALRMRRGMYEGGLHCVSFHMRKHIKIGRGGMVLTDDADAAEWLRKARFDGRTGSIPFMQDQVDMLGWNCYMLPEHAARGLQLLEALTEEPPDLTPDYPDLSKLPVFAQRQ